MPTAAIVNVSLRARHEQFTSDMDKMSSAGKKWAGDMQGSGGRVSKILESVGLSNGVASRSFGQVATGALLASGAMDSAGQAGQALTHTLGAFMAGGPIAGGVTLLAEGYKFLAGEQAKAAEESKKRADEELRALEREKAKTDELIAKIRERELAAKADATGTPLAELKIQEEILALERDTFGVRGASVGQMLDRLAILRDELAVMQERRESERLSELGAVMMLGVVTELKIAEIERTKNAKHLADAAKEQAEIEKRNREQWQAGEAIVRNMEEARLRSINQFVAQQRILVGLKADELPFADIIQKREEAILGGLNDQVVALDAILARKQRQAELVKAIAAAEKTQTSLAQAQAAADRQAAQDAKKDAAATKAATGGGAGVGSSGGSGGGGSPGFGGGSGGPLSAAREAKRAARQQARWKRHADNLGAEQRESMSYGTIQDGGFDPFASDLGSVMGQYKPGNGKAPKAPMTVATQQGSDESAAALKALNEAALANNIAQAKAADAARSAADATGQTAEKAGDAAKAGEDTATAAAEASTSLAALAASGVSAAAAVTGFAPSVAALAKSLKEITDAFATMQAAVSGS